MSQLKNETPSVYDIELRKGMKLECPEFKDYGPGELVGIYIKKGMLYSQDVTLLIRFTNDEDQWTEYWDIERLTF